MGNKFIPYAYYKATVGQPTPSPQTKRRRYVRLLPAIFITVGSILLSNVAWPLISYQLFIAPEIRRSEVISPIPSSELGSRVLLAPTPATVFASNGETLGTTAESADFTDPKNWFPSAGYTALPQVTSYTLDIPKIDIDKAQVDIGGDELDRSLIHYPGTALPGELGSPVIFGHSILRQFYNPAIDNPDRYISIFSKIMTLENGDRIYLTYDGVRYTYEVKEKVEVQPDDLFILEQRYNNRTLKLITCVPEGTYLRRGVVIAQLVNLNYHDEARAL